MAPSLTLVGLALRGSKIRKKALAALLWGVLLLSALAVATRNRLVQNALASWVTGEISESLQAPISVGLVQVDFLRNFHLEDVYVGDAQGDTLFFVRSLDAQLNDFDWWEQNLVFGRVLAVGLELNMGYHAQTQANNYQHLFDQIFSSGPAKGKPWSWRIEQVDLKGGRYRYFDLRNYKLSKVQEEAWAYGLEKGRFDASYIDFSAIEMQAGPCYLDSLGDPQFHIKRMQTQERSGLFVKQFQTDLGVKHRFLRFRNTELQTPCSQIRWLMDLDYRHEYALDSVFEHMLWMGDVEEAEICTRDLAHFNSWFDHRNGKISAIASFEGPLGHLEVPGFSLNVGANTNLNGSYWLDGLPRVEALVHRVELADSKLVPGDLEPLFPGEDWVRELGTWGEWVADANFDLDTTRLYVQGNVNSGKGRFDGWYRYDLKSEGSEFAAELNDFNAGFALGESQIGLLDGALAGNFRDVPGPHMLVDVNGTLQRVELLQQTLKEVELRLNLTQNSADGHWVCHDERFQHEAWIQVSNLQDVPKWSLSADVNALNFKAFGLDSVPSLLLAQIEVEGQSFDPDAFIGQVFVRNLDWMHNGEVLHIDKQSLRRRTEPRWQFDGDALKGDIVGRFHPSQSQNLVQTVLHDWVPQRFAAAAIPSSDSFVAHLAVLKTDWLSHFLFPTAQVDPFEWELSIKPGSQFSLVTGSMQVRMDGCQIQDARIQATRTKQSPLRVQVQSPFMRVGRTEYDNWGLDLQSTGKDWKAHAWVHDRKNRYSIDVNTRSYIGEEFISTTIDSSHLRLYDKEWRLDPSATVRMERSGALQIKRLSLSDGDHYFELKGRIGAELTDTAVVEFYNLTPEILEPFLAEHTLDSLDGHAMGKITGIALLGRARMSADLSVNNVMWNQHDYGQLGLQLSQHKNSDMLSLTVHSESGPLQGIEVYGGVDITDYARDRYNWDLFVELPKSTPVQILQPMLSGVLTFESGYLSGFVHSYSVDGEPQIQGSIRAKNVWAHVDYLGTRFLTTADFEIRNDGLYSVKPFRVSDESRLNYAWGSLKLQHKKYENLRLDLRLDSAKNMKILNTTEKDNSLFYGTAWADGHIRIHGPLLALDMDIDLTPRRNSQLTILYESDHYNEVSGAIRFKSKGSVAAAAAPREGDDYLNRVNVVVHANPDLDAQFVIDKQLGDAIRGHGRGTLRMLYDEQEQFFLFGSLELNDGEYVFSIPGINVLTKRVSLDPGGSIVWTGDPYNADIRLEGHYEKKISPVALLAGTPSASAVAPTRIVSILKLSGSLIRPNIEFDIQAPDLASSATASANEANAVIQRIRSDKDETMRQAVALLLFGNFIPPSFSSGNPLETNMISGAGVAGNSVSTIASSVVNDLFAKYGVPTRIQVNIDDVRSASGNTNTQVFVNSEWFLSDRLRLDLNYDPTVSMLVNNLSVPLNFNLEYMTRNEDWKLKAFSRSSNLLLDQSGSGSIGNGVSGNTLGAGAIYKREFHTFRTH